MDEHGLAGDDDHDLERPLVDTVHSDCDTESRGVFSTTIRPRGRSFEQVRHASSSSGAAGSGGGDGSAGKRVSLVADSRLLPGDKTGEVGPTSGSSGCVSWVSASSGHGWEGDKGLGMSGEEPSWVRGEVTEGAVMQPLLGNGLPQPMSTKG